MQPSTIYGIVSREEEKSQNKKRIKISSSENKSILERIINEHNELWKKADLVPSLPRGYKQRLIKSYPHIIKEEKEKIFGKTTKNLDVKLEEIALNYFVKFPKNIWHTGLSTIAIAGFGEKEIFPSLITFDIEGAISGILKFREGKHSEVNFNNRAIIIPFAQGKAETSAFMEGITSNYRAEIESFVEGIFENYTPAVIDKIQVLEKSEKEQVKKELRKFSKDHFKRFLTDFDEYRRRNYIAPVINVVAFLSKDKLAEMAESLVNLSSMKRHFSMEEETVGGPIDVAVISKGDGFIWIKRKHYFDPKLNQHFFRNYFGEVQNDKEIDSKQKTP